MRTTVQHIIENPFGLDFKKIEGKTYITAISALNFLGYIDFLERIIGVARLTFGLFALAVCDTRQQRLLASAHVLRGICEMMGNFEFYLFVFDTAATVVNLVKNFFFKKQNSSTSPESIASPRAGRLSLEQLASA